MRCESLTAGALSLPQGRRAPYPHGFFICGSCRINVLFLPSQTGTMDQHFFSPLLITSCFYVCTCLSVCVFTSFLFSLTFPPLCLPSGNHIRFRHCFIPLLFLSLLSISACTSGTSSTRKHEAHIQFMLFFNLISKPTGYSSTEVFIYIDKFLSPEPFTSQQMSGGS